MDRTCFLQFTKKMMHIEEKKRRRRRSRVEQVICNMKELKTGKKVKSCFNNQELLRLPRLHMNHPNDITSTMHILYLSQTFSLLWLLLRNCNDQDRAGPGRNMGYLLGISFHIWGYTVPNFVTCLLTAVVFLTTEQKI